MPGIVLLDDDQQLQLSRSQRRAVHLNAPNQHQAPPPRYHRSSLPSDRTLLPEDFVVGTGSPRTNFMTNRQEPRTDFTNGNRKGFGETQRTLATITMSMDYPDHPSTLEKPHSDSYPMLRDVSPSSSRESTTDDGGGEYAGTSSGLKISVRWIMVGLIAGLVLGLFLSEAKVSSVAARWIGLPGDLFLRALKCLVVPYVFCSVAVAVGDIVFVGKVSVVGIQTAKIYVVFWLATVAMGVTVALLFRPSFRSLDVKDSLPASAVGFTCSNKLLMTTMTNGSTICSTNATAITNMTAFVVQDINDVFAKSTSTVTSLTLSDQIMQTILPIVSKNIVSSLANNELLSVITFSMVLGAIAGRNYFTKTRRTNYVYLSLLQLRNSFFLMMEWTIWLSPLAVVSIIAGSFATNPGVISTLRHAYPYLLAALSAALLQMLVVYPLIVFLTTRCNPFSYMKRMVRAYMFAFASASSLATMPVTLSCVKAAKTCSQSIGNFVISIGVVSSVSGIGFYLPIALVFIAESSGNGDKITALRVVGMSVLSLVTCAGTPPIPAAGLVVISTAYTTLFGDVPATAFAYVAAMDFFFDRIVTVCNVNDDLMALKIISETTDETVAQDQLGERF